MGEETNTASASKGAGERLRDRAQRIRQWVILFGGAVLVAISLDGAVDKTGLTIGAVICGAMIAALWCGSRK